MMVEQSRALDISLSTLASLVAVVAFSWVFIKPGLIAVVSDVYADELSSIKDTQEQHADELKDIKSSLSNLNTTLSDVAEKLSCAQAAEDIRALEDEIEKLEEEESASLEPLIANKRDLLQRKMVVYLKCIE